MGQRIRVPDERLVKWMEYAAGKVHMAVEEYEREALPNTLVMANLRVAESLIKDVQKQFNQRL